MAISNNLAASAAAFNLKENPQELHRLRIFLRFILLFKDSGARADSASEVKPPQERLPTTQ